VDVELEPQNGSGTHRAHIAVERRTDPVRRDGHTPPVVASAKGGKSGNLAKWLSGARGATSHLLVALDTFPLPKIFLKKKPVFA
jgi:hypothetical protein